MNRCIPIVLFLLSPFSSPGQGIVLNMPKCPMWDTVHAFKVQLPFVFHTNIKLAQVHKPVPPDFYTKHFGFFCKQELIMQKAGVPFSFRLGSMEYCNMLEQKGH